MSVPTSMSTDSFWNAVNILTTKFNVINKRIWGCKKVHNTFCKAVQEWTIPLNIRRLETNENLDTYVNLLLYNLNLMQSTGSDSTTNCVEIIVIELFSKLYTFEKAFQLVIQVKSRATVSFYDITPSSFNHSLVPGFQYTIKLENSQVLLIATNPDSSCKSYKWLVNTVLPQFVKWGEASIQDKFCNESLSLISADKYYKKYNELKLKYGKKMVEIWPENTDPSKYVYEDVAIATYLLLLWESEVTREKKTFVDLGCGNGLLVYILTKEGHDGLGIDVRKRQIWDMYPKNVQLLEKTIIPSDINLFPKADWIIGNHSDELTPWIPVIAARSSFKCNFFLLPCCAYNFNGTKYQRKDSSKSQYMEYLAYIKEICDNCGFDTKIDRLKIPSTKRICLVGQNRVHSTEQYDKYCRDIQFIINESNMQNKTVTNRSSWSSDFKPRVAVEKVQNCTQIDKSVIDSIVSCITKFLLEECHQKTQWCCGKIVNISDIITLLSVNQLKAMKAECGGLQTLLRNNHHIFKVQSGKVQLRFPKTVEEVNSKSLKKDSYSKYIKIKQKPCWFYINHPQGCPLDDKMCSYLH